MNNNEKQFFESLRKLLKKHKAIIGPQRMEQQIEVLFKEDPYTFIIESRFLCGAIHQDNFHVTEQNEFTIPSEEE